MGKIKYSPDPPFVYHAFIKTKQGVRMYKNKIVDLSLYRKKKEPPAKASKSSDKDLRSFEKKLQDLMYRPFNEIDSKKELIAIFEEQDLPDRP